MIVLRPRSMAVIEGSTVVGTTRIEGGDLARSSPRMGAGSGDKTQTLTLLGIPSARAGPTVSAVAAMLSEAVNACQRGAGSAQAARRRARGRPGRRRRG